MTSLPQWLGLGLTILVVLGGTGVNLFFMGRFVGKWGELMNHLSKTIADVEERLEAAEAHGDQTAHKVGLMDQRLAGAEAAASKFWEMRDEFTAMRTTIELEGKYARDTQESIKRSIAVIERQLGNLVTTRGGFTTLHSDDKN